MCISSLVASERLLGGNPEPELREKLEKQAAACRNSASKRAQELMLLEELAELLIRSPIGRPLD
jgi:hypothetical protein